MYEETDINAGCLTSRHQLVQFDMSSAMYSLWSLLVALVLVSSSQSQIIDPQDSNVLEQEQLDWSEWLEDIHHHMEESNQQRGDDPEVHLSSFWGEILQLLEASSFPTAVAKDINQKCIDDSKSYVKSLATGHLWALQMHESTASGLPIGKFKNFNSHVYGLFDECLAVRATKLGFRGQYCSVYLRPTLTRVGSSHVAMNRTSQPAPKKAINWVTLYQFLDMLGYIIGRETEPTVVKPGFYDPYMPGMGFCIPSSCSAQDFGQAVAQIVGKRAFSAFKYELKIATATSEHHCFTEKEDPPQFDGPEITVLTILSVIGFLVVTATIHESVRIWFDRPIDSKKDGIPIRMLHCFSAYNNTVKLMSTKASSDNIGCIHGIRVMSTLWVILGHSFLNAGQLGPNTFLSQQDGKNWSFQIIGNGTVSVDTFFFLSGMLVTYLFLRELDRNKGRFNVILFYVHRYLRLTPVYGIILGFIATLVVYVGAGPNWGNAFFASENCRKNWWKNLLYVNNFLQTTEDGCMAETWYLANDMQFYLISPLLIYPLWRWKIYGVVWIVLLTLASLGGIVATYIVDKIPTTLMISRPFDSYVFDPNFMDKYYFMPWCRIPPYLVGILMGYVLHINRKSQIKLPKYLVVLGWVSAVTIGFAVLFGVSSLLDPKAVPKIDDATRVIYGSFHRFAWSIAVAWVVFACIQGYGGVVNRFLSWSFFAPLGRLTYCVYLIHLNFITMYIARMRTPIYYTAFDTVMLYFSFLIISFCLAFVASLTVEASFLNLEKLLFSLGGGKSAGSKQQSHAVSPAEKDPELAQHQK